MAKMVTNIDGGRLRNNNDIARIESFETEDEFVDAMADILFDNLENNFSGEDSEFMNEMDYLNDLEAVVVADPKEAVEAVAKSTKNILDAKNSKYAYGLNGQGKYCLLMSFAMGEKTLKVVVTPKTQFNGREVVFCGDDYIDDKSDFYVLDLETESDISANYVIKKVINC